MKTVKVGINGVGRIGRTILRAYFARVAKDANYNFEIVAVNNPGEPKPYVHLLKHDSLHGKLQGDFAFDNDKREISYNGRKIKFFSSRNPEELDWSSVGAQIVIDQYLSAAEDKWKMQNGLVLFLPHGYEGQGAEHSSARMERYLQLCAKDNMFVVDVTTPANLFHVLRRQQKAAFRKPLVVFTPKSLLRHPKVVSTKEEFANGQFQPLIDETELAAEQVKTLVLCTGKFYYDLLARREETGRNDVALVRLEQLFPLPVEELDAVLAKYSHVSDVVWAQEEPRNMGAYSHLLLHYDKARDFRVASRRFYGAPAAGSAVRAARRHQQVIDYVFDQTRDNFKL
jgi:2-oxoglutarate dehydrogenase E1 component